MCLIKKKRIIMYVFICKKVIYEKKKLWYLCGGELKEFM